MVVELKFTDGSTAIRTFTDDELNNFKLLDKLLDYIKENLSPDHPIDSYEIFDRKKCSVVEDYNVRMFDLRDYFNYSKSLVGAVVDNKVVEGFKFFNNDSYEYGIDSLEGEPYERGIKLNYTLDHYYYSKLAIDPENWEK